MKDFESLTVISVEFYCKVNPACFRGVNESVWVLKHAERIHLIGSVSLSPLHL